MKQTVLIWLWLAAFTAAAEDVLIRDRVIRSTRSNVTDVGRSDLPMANIYGGRFWRYGVELLPQTNSGAAERVIWSHSQTLYYPQELEEDTNVTILTLTATNQLLLRLDYSYHFVFHYNNAYDGRYFFGGRWTDPSGGARNEKFFDMISDYDWTDGGNLNYSKAGSVVLGLRNGTTLTLTNRMIISSVGDGTGPLGGADGTNYFQASLTQLKP